VRKKAGRKKRNWGRGETSAWERRSFDASPFMSPEVPRKIKEGPRGGKTPGGKGRGRKAGAWRPKRESTEEWTGGGRKKETP